MGPAPLAQAPLKLNFIYSARWALPVHGSRLSGSRHGKARARLAGALRAPESGSLCIYHINTCRWALCRRLDA